MNLTKLNQTQNTYLCKIYASHHPTIDALIKLYCIFNYFI